MLRKIIKWGRRSMKKKIVFILSLSCCIFLLGGCSEAKQEKQKTNNPFAYTSTEFETTEISAQEDSYVLHASKIHYKEPTALETVINNIIHDAKGKIYRVLELCCR